MRIDTAQQAITLLLFFMLGFLLGIMYDSLTPLRRDSGKFVAALLDLAFSIHAGALIFLLALRFSPDGRSGFWQLFSTLLGFIVYINTFRQFVYKFFQFSYYLPNILVQTIKKFLKNCRFL